MEDIQKRLTANANDFDGIIMDIKAEHKALTDEVKHKQESIQVIGFMLAQEKAEVARLSEALGEAKGKLIHAAKANPIYGKFYTGAVDAIDQLLNTKGPTDCEILADLDDLPSICKPDALLNT